MASLIDILKWFGVGKIPTAAEFQQTFSSFRHKEENVPVNAVEGLTGLLNNKLGTNHTSDETAHTNVLLKKDASNLTPENKAAFKEALGIGDLPENIATVDNEQNGVDGNVFDKNQIRSDYMSQVDFVENGKIRRDRLGDLDIELTSSDESLLIQDNDIASNVSLFSEEFETVPADLVILSFPAVQIIGVYDSGIKLNKMQYTQVTTQRITLKLPRVGDYVEVLYTHLKTDQ